MTPLRQTAVIFRAETRRALRHPKTYALFGLFLVFSLLVLAITSSLTASLMELQRQVARDTHLTPDDLSRGAEELKTPLIWVLFGGDAGVVSLLKDVPAVILVLFKAILQFLPLYAALLGFDQLSGEVSTRSIRFQTVRARRTSILLGKLASQAALLLALVGSVLLIVFLWAALEVPGYGAAYALPQLMRFTLAGGVYVVTFVALAGLWSSVAAQPALSLLLNLISLSALWTADVIGSLAAKPRIALDPSGAPAAPEGSSVLPWLRFLSPFHYVPDLFNASLPRFWGGLAAEAGFAAVFIGLAWVVFRQRDL